MNETAERLVDLAEGHIRNAGYGGFSFRDLAAAVGIKSASVHHHFPTKATMATAVVRRYGDRFFAAVAPLPDETPADAVATYRSAFQAALERDGLMCLCGVLGAEAGVLSGDVAEAIRSFFRRCIEDLSARIGGPRATAKAFHVMATLEGGMMLARAYGSIEAFDQATMCLVQSPLDARVTRGRRTCSAIVCGVRVEQSARSGTLALPSGASD